ncbi:42033_t:CDS:2 [Gigaspora margarita]|uniref:42033_t:CDS:1 n=1 Tax=Gigaspora margarita TaxID=4874 RepID=A0ABM8W1T9_GIGMA|nr:42033_t:CDS:2 [Gigaspora margarita]
MTKFIPMPQSPYYREKVVIKIVARLCNLNIQTGQNGVLLRPKKWSFKGDPFASILNVIQSLKNSTENSKMCTSQREPQDSLPDFILDVVQIELTILQVCLLFWLYKINFIIKIILVLTKARIETADNTPYNCSELWSVYINYATY